MEWKCYLMRILLMKYLERNNHNLKFDENSNLKNLLVGKYFILILLKGFIITIYLLVVGSYLPSFTYYGMKPLK